MRRISFIIICLTLFLLSGCHTTKTTTKSTAIPTEKLISLPALYNLSREEIKNKLDELNIEYVFGFDQSRYYGPNKYDRFVKYQNHNTYDLVKENQTVRIITSPLELPDIDVEELKFTRDATNKSFLNDSYGYCTWTGRYNDGDTTSFYDNKTRQIFNVRFLSIDTPEVDHGNNQYDPWGNEASDFVRNMLENAKEIIVESELDYTTGTDVYGRYLAYVWVDGICLNYNVVCNAYSNNTGGDKSKYFKYFSEAEELVSKTGRRFYGEYDPYYTLY